MSIEKDPLATPSSEASSPKEKEEPLAESSLDKATDEFSVESEMGPDAKYSDNYKGDSQESEALRSKLFELKKQLASKLGIDTSEPGWEDEVEKQISERLDR